MNTQKYRWILYLITITIITTIGVQLYWNYKNYQENKSRIINEIQISLDNAIEVYFAEATKNTAITILNLHDKEHPLNYKKENVRFNIDSINSILESVTKKLKKDLSNKNENIADNIDSTETNQIKKIYVYNDTSAEKLKKKVLVTFTQDTIFFNQLYSHLKNELTRKNLKIPAFKLNLYIKNRLIDSYLHNKLIGNYISIFPKSTYLKEYQKLELLIKNPTLEALKRSSISILLSLLLTLAVIFSLFYLLYIIKQQKELNLIKNDLISNITHEFKTPITTASAAIEAIGYFNVINDTEKTKNYVSISNNQLKKLHQMVEKLLETATLNSDNLYLKKEKNDIIFLIQNQVNKHQLITEKNISFSKNTDQAEIILDIFHFENAISNLIDNAIKYGGDIITVTLKVHTDKIEISVSDNGNGIDKNKQNKIFDKFYRIPQGNTHNVKGFGIGLFYTKKIIEKHGATITVTSKPKETTFKITLPND